MENWPPFCPPPLTKMVISKSLYYSGAPQTNSSIINLKQATNGALNYPNELAAYHKISRDGPGTGADAFVRHLAAALTDVYFVLSGAYEHRHVPQPICLSEDIGSKANGYFYQYANGRVAFPWQFPDVIVTLAEWIEFCNAFNKTGINVWHNVSDPESPSSQNIVLAGYDISTLIETGDLPPSWVRIDFDYQSCLVNWEKFFRFVRENEVNIEGKLGSMMGVMKLAQQTSVGRPPRDVRDAYHEQLSRSDINFFNMDLAIK